MKRSDRESWRLRINNNFFTYSIHVTTMTRFLKENHFTVFYEGKLERHRKEGFFTMQNEMIKYYKHFQWVFVRVRKFKKQYERLRLSK